MGNHHCQKSVACDIEWNALAFDTCKITTLSPGLASLLNNKMFALLDYSLPLLDNLLLKKKDPSICSGVDKIPDLFQIS
jgi:hypothetical protein